MQDSMSLHNETYHMKGDSPIEEQENNVLNLVMSLFFFITSPVGILGNSIFLWTLGFRMRKTVNTVLFSSLVLSGLSYSMIMPILGVYVLQDFTWTYGTVLCKLVNTLISLCMYASVFILTIVSLDRYILVVHPVWARSFRTPQRALVITVAVWISAFMLSAPYLAFRVVRPGEKNKSTCSNNYMFSDDWDDQEIQSGRRKIHLCFFLIRLLLGFLIPFLIITACYGNTAFKVKIRRLSRSSKFIKVIVVSVLSFFVCWLPYHIFYALSMYREYYPELLIQVVMSMAIVCSCANVCFTPIFYLFIGENFKAIFKKSLLSLIESTFGEECDLTV
ncbi:probable G-protein coupled receptor 33 [Ambystoma mexicanum]|uniref:probable G-protein coupled receptor 33 n=1 Tax=Ambystoma mexicanum TaxID=8296 RepID=UPI0037E92A80